VKTSLEVGSLVSIRSSFLEKCLEQNPSLGLVVAMNTLNDSGGSIHWQRTIEQMGKSYYVFFPDRGVIGPLFSSDIVDAHVSTW
jgi:hypothetical protein